jgi:hypothetical protein
MTHNPFCAFDLRGNDTSDHLRVRVKRERGKLAAVRAMDNRADSEDEDVHAFPRRWMSVLLMTQHQHRRESSNERNAATRASFSKFCSPELKTL